MIKRILSLLLTFLLIGQNISFCAGFNFESKFYEPGLWGLDSLSKSNFLYKESISFLDLESFLLASEKTSRFWVNLHPFLAPGDLLSNSLKGTDLGWIFLSADLSLKRDLQKTIERVGILSNAQFLSDKDLLLRAWIEPGEVEIFRNGNSFFIKKATFRVRIENRGNYPLPKSYIFRMQKWLSKRVNHSSEYLLLRRVFRAYLLGKIKAKFLSGKKGRNNFSVPHSFLKWKTSFYQSAYVDLLHKLSQDNGVYWTSGGVVFDTKLEVNDVSTHEFYDLRLRFNKQNVKRLLEGFPAFKKSLESFEQMKGNEQELINFLSGILDKLKTSQAFTITNQEERLLVNILTNLDEKLVNAVFKSLADVHEMHAFLAKVAMQVDRSFLVSVEKYSVNPEVALYATLLLFYHYPFKAVTRKYSFAKALLAEANNLIPNRKVLLEKNLPFSVDFPFLSHYVLGAIAATGNRSFKDIAKEALDFLTNVTKSDVAKNTAVCFILGFLAQKTIVKGKNKTTIQKLFGQLSEFQTQRLMKYILADVQRWNIGILSEYMPVYGGDVAKMVVDMLTIVSEQEAAEFLNGLAQNNLDFLYALTENDNFSHLLKRIVSKDKDLLSPKAVLAIYSSWPLETNMERVQLNWLNYVVEKNKDKFPVLASFSAETFSGKADNLLGEFSKIANKDLHQGEIYIDLLNNLPVKKLQLQHIKLEVMKRLYEDKDLPALLRMRAFMYLTDSKLERARLKYGARFDFVKELANFSEKIMEIWREDKNSLLNSLQTELMPEVMGYHFSRFALEDAFLITSLNLWEDFIYPIFSNSSKNGSVPLYRFISQIFSAKFVYKLEYLANSDYEVDRLQMFIVKNHGLSSGADRTEFLTAIAHEVGHNMVRVVMEELFGKEALKKSWEATKQYNYVRAIDEFLAEYVGLYFCRNLLGHRAIDRMLSSLSSEQDMILLNTLSENRLSLYTLVRLMLVYNDKIFSLLEPHSFFRGAIKKFYGQIEKTKVVNSNFVLEFYDYVRESLLSKMQNEKIEEQKGAFLGKSYSVLDFFLDSLKGVSSERGNKELTTRGTRFLKEKTINPEQKLAAYLEELIPMNKEKDFAKEIFSLLKGLRVDRKRKWLYLFGQRDPNLGLILFEKFMLEGNLSLAPKNLLPSGLTKDEFLKQVEKISRARSENPYIVAIAVLTQQYLNQRGITISMGDIWKVFNNHGLKDKLEETMTLGTSAATNFFPFFNPTFGDARIREQCVNKGVLPMNIESMLALVDTADSFIRVEFVDADTLLGPEYLASLAYFAVYETKNESPSYVFEKAYAFSEPQKIAKDFLRLLETRQDKDNVLSLIQTSQFCEVLRRFSVLVKSGNELAAKEFFDKTVYPMLGYFLTSKDLDRALSAGKPLGVSAPKTLSEWFIYWIGNVHFKAVRAIRDTYLERNDKEGLYKFLANSVEKVLYTKNYVVPSAMKFFDKSNPWISKMNLTPEQLMELNYKALRFNLLVGTMHTEAGLSSEGDYMASLDELRAVLTAEDSPLSIDRIGVAWKTVASELVKDTKFIKGAGILPFGVGENTNGEQILFVYLPWGWQTQKVLSCLKELFDLHMEELDNSIKFLDLLRQTRGLLTEKGIVRPEELSGLGREDIILSFKLGPGFESIKEFLDKAYDSYEKNPLNDLLLPLSIEDKGLVGFVGGKALRFNDEPEMEQEVVVPSDILNTLDNESFLVKMSVLAKLPYRGQDWKAAKWFYKNLLRMKDLGVKQADEVLSKAERVKDTVIGQEAKGGIKFNTRNFLIRYNR